MIMHAWIDTCIIRAYTQWLKWSAKISNQGDGCHQPVWLGGSLSFCYPHQESCQAMGVTWKIWWVEDGGIILKWWLNRDNRTILPKWMWNIWIHINLPRWKLKLMAILLPRGAKMMSLTNDYVNLCDDVSWMIEVSASWMLDTNWTCYYYMSEQWRMRYRETTRELAHRAVIFGKKWLWCTQHQLWWVLQEIPASKELTALRGLVK